MCPFCFATVAWIAAGVTATGGVSALLMCRGGGKRTEHDNNAIGEGGQNEQQH
jgi:hypothetical protein